MKKLRIVNQLYRLSNEEVKKVAATFSHALLQKEAETNEKLDARMKQFEKIGTKAYRKEHMQDDNGPNEAEAYLEVLEDW